MSDETIIVNETVETVTVEETIETVIVNETVETVTVEETIENITVEETIENIIVTPLGEQGPKGDKGDPGSGVSTDETIILGASNCPVDNTEVTYNVEDLPEVITYEDTSTYTNNTKTITYTNGLPTQVQHIFTYESQVWTFTKPINYNIDGLPSSWPYTLSKV